MYNVINFLMIIYVMGHLYKFCIVYAFNFISVLLGESLKYEIISTAPSYHTQYV